MDFPIEMYKIRDEEMTIKIPCESCYEKGMVIHNCHKCGGKGVHNKTIKVWKVSRKTVTIEKISRGGSNQTSYDGGLRYWTDSSEFYNEYDLYLHFTKEDAQKECDKRNRDISNILNNISREEKWKQRWTQQMDSNMAGDFGDYLYDFYPEMLM